MIKVENLSKTFPTEVQPVVSSISFELPTGQIGCIVGTSGSGKTTTLKMINRLIEPSSGQVYINNQESQNVDSVHWRRQIGYVIQSGGLLPHLTVKENISLLSSILKKDKSAILRRLSELLEMVGLPENEFGERYPRELSGGQRQRVGIARALMENPPVLLMDEPFGALDPITRRALHAEFLDLNKKLNKTILLVTHDINEAFKLGNSIILMDQGRIVKQGTPVEFQKEGQNDFVREFIAEHSV